MYDPKPLNDEMDRALEELSRNAVDLESFPLLSLDNLDAPPDCGSVDDRPPAPSGGATTKATHPVTPGLTSPVTLRLQTWLVTIYREEAARTGTPYQTLIKCDLEQLAKDRIAGRAARPRTER